MIGLVVSLSVAAGLLSGSQEGRPTFTADVYIVRTEISMFTRRFGLFARPYRDLAIDDVRVVLDDQTYSPADLSEDPEKPGHYLVGFTPPAEYRDGASHVVSLIVSMNGRPGIKLPERSMTFPRPSRVEGAEQPTGVSGP